jgi:hypothetical protein
MTTHTVEALTERVTLLELELKELRMLVELQSTVLKRLTGHEVAEQPVVIPDADDERTPSAELALLVGAEPATLRKLVGRLADNDLEELRDGAVDELDREGPLWAGLVALGEAGTFDEPEALAALVREHSKAAPSGKAAASRPGRGPTKSPRRPR